MNYREFVKFRDFLYHKTGIYLDDKKESSIVNKLHSYLSLKEYTDFRALFHDLRFSRDCNIMQDIINLITINETYFYREKHHFDSLMNHLLPEIDKQKNTNEPIRILCAPSSTGEEPYTIALSLLEEEHILSKRDIEIVAIDIDSSAIEKAKKGIYTQRSVQFVPTHTLKRFFKTNQAEFCISDSLKNAINFKVLNIMDKNEMRKLGKFDVIFSRNMLIYFDDESRRETGMTFYDILNQFGVIFLGHADNMSRISSLFKTKQIGDSLVYQKYSS